MRAGLVACTLLALGVLAISEHSHRRGREAIAELSDRLDAQQRLQALQAALAAAEAEQRGYLLGGDERHLRAYEQAVLAIGSTLQALRDDARAEPQAAERIARVEQAAATHLARLDRAVASRRADPPGPASAGTATDALHGDLQAAHADIDALIEQAQRHRLSVTQRWERMRAGSRLGIALACLLAVMACVLAMRQGALVTRERDAQRRQLQAERDALDDNVERRTEDLVRLASHLQNSREDERAKLARELHDELGAVLTAAKLDVAWLGAKLKGHDPALLDKLRALKSVLEDAIQLKRRIIEDLRPSLLTNLGLVPALQRLVTDQRTRFAGRLDAEIDEDVELPEDIALVVYRIAQEALTNVHKYAQARNVELTLRRLPPHLELRVADDGVGFDVSRVDAARHGLAGMRHRLLSIRGTLQVDAAPGRGTTITARVPLVEIEAAQARQAAAQAGGMPDEAPWGAGEAASPASAAGSSTAAWPAAPMHP